MTTPLSDLTLVEHNPAHHSGTSAIRFPNGTLATCTDWELAVVLMREALDGYEAEGTPDA